tara:strand:- start:1564 stop:2013 length:450 start_codon:yes stop_codon:yes gene_type:complete
MNRIINFTLLLLLLSSCAYEPILNNNQNFSINIIKITGDQTVNSIISKEFKNLKENEKKFDLIIVSTKEKKILSKNSKGDPSIFELLINVNYIVKKDGKIIIQNEINKRSTYNNITDKFEMENYEKNIIYNLSTSITDRIIYSISKLNE